jgi:hypothetical protein
MGMREFTLLLLAAVAPIGLPHSTRAQSLAESGDASSAVAWPSPETRQPQLAASYTCPTQKERFHSYFFDVLGPSLIVGAAFAAGINQADYTLPEWKPGAEGYGKRVGSDFGIAAVLRAMRPRKPSMRTHCIAAVQLGVTDFKRIWRL